MRRLPTLLLSLLFAYGAVAQDDAADDTAAETTAAEEIDADAAAGTAERESDDTEIADVDDESYLDIEDDDFRPSEEIPSDQSITFPTDI